MRCHLAMSRNTIHQNKATGSSVNSFSGEEESLLVISPFGRCVVSWNTHHFVGTFCAPNEQEGNAS
jgi:hypothetical protein